MALQLNFNLCVINACSQIRFTETTGVYSTSNLTGWGAPNIVLGDALTAVLTVTNPSGIVYTIDLFATTLFPTSDTSFTYDIPLVDIGSPTSIVDGQWLFTYTVTDLTTTYSTSIYKLFYCNSECCVTKMQPDISTCDSCNEGISYDNYLLAWIQLESLKKAAKCGDTTNFTKIKKIVDKLCLNSECKTCK